MRITFSSLKGRHTTKEPMRENTMSNMQKVEGLDKLITIFSAFSNSVCAGGAASDDAVRLLNPAKKTQKDWAHPLPNMGRRNSQSKALDLHAARGINRLCVW